MQENNTFILFVLFPDSSPFNYTWSYFDRCDVLSDHVENTDQRFSK